MKAPRPPGRPSTKPLGQFAEIGLRVRAVRERVHLHPDEFSQALEISRQGLQMIEAGHRKPSAAVLAMLQKVYGVAPQEIMLGEATPRREVPCYRVAAGGGLEAVTDDGEQILVPADLQPHRVDYALRVIGDSMLEAGIHDGDQLFIRADPAPPDGAIVVVWRRADNLVTLKRYRRLPGKKIRLEPAHPELAAFEWDGRDDNVRIQGVPVGLLRIFPGELPDKQGGRRGS